MGFDLYLDSMPLKPACFWSTTCQLQGSLSHHCMCSSCGCGSKGVKKVTIPDSLKGGGGALKGKFLPRGWHVPLVASPGSTAYVV